MTDTRENRLVETFVTLTDNLVADYDVIDVLQTLVDRSVEPRSGHIVVAMVHGDRTMKRLRRRGGRLWLLPEPAAGFDFPETIVDEHVELWGVVVGLGRDHDL